MFQSPCEAEDARYNTFGHSANSWSAGNAEAGRIDYLFYRTRAGAGLGASTSVYRTVDARVGAGGRLQMSMNGTLDAPTDGFSLSDHMGVEATVELTFNSKCKTLDKSKSGAYPPSK